MQEWLKIAKTLECGRRRRVACCGADYSRVISHTSKGWGTSCFRCGDNHWKPHGDLTLSDRLRFQNELKAFQGTTLAFPLDFTYDIPPVGRLWLLKAGISADLARSFDIGWSESMNRVIVPVFDDDGNLAAIQARAVHPWQKPKYLNKQANVGLLYLLEDDYSELPNTLVLTEDVLSAIRVSAICDTGSTLGTMLHPHTIAPLIKKYKQVIVWYDADAAGRRGAHKAAKQLDLQGFVVRNMYTPKDPKLYNNEEIREFLT